MHPLSRLRRPEYTGENRCLPCTIGNGAILVAGCLGLAVVSPLLALVVFVAGSGAIALRGYLVPYTPALTARIHERFDGGPIRPPSGSLTPEADDALGEHTLAALLDAGVLVAEDDRLFLGEGFREAWRGEMERLGGLSEAALIAETESTTELDVELLDADRPLVVLVGPDGGETWVSLPVTVAEVGADRALERATSLSDRHRLAAARALRGFLDRCPVCETQVEETSPRRCCGSYRSRDTLPESVLACPACDEWLYRFDGE